MHATLRFAFALLTSSVLLTSCSAVHEFLGANGGVVDVRPPLMASVAYDKVEEDKRELQLTFANVNGTAFKLVDSRGNDITDFVTDAVLVFTFQESGNKLLLSVNGSKPTDYAHGGTITEEYFPVNPLFATFQSVTEDRLWFEMFGVTAYLNVKTK